MKSVVCLLFAGVVMASPALAQEPAQVRRFR